MCFASEYGQLNKCHKPLPCVGFFCYNYSREKKISPMKKYVKIALKYSLYALLIWSAFMNFAYRGTTPKVGYRSSGQ